MGHRLRQRADDFVLNIDKSHPFPHLFSTKVFFDSPPQLPIPNPPFLPRPSDSLFIKEMKSICIIHFFCELFPLPGACSLCIGSRAIDRRPRKSKGIEIPFPLGQDGPGTKVRPGPLLTDTSGSIILSPQNEGHPALAIKRQQASSLREPRSLAGMEAWFPNPLAASWVGKKRK